MNWGRNYRCKPGNWLYSDLVGEFKTFIPSGERRGGKGKEKEGAMQISLAIIIVLPRSLSLSTTTPIVYIRDKSRWQVYGKVMAKKTCFCFCLFPLGFHFFAEFLWGRTNSPRQLGRGMLSNEKRLTPRGKSWKFKMVRRSPPSSQHS